MEVLQNSQKFRVGIRMLYDSRTRTRVMCHGRTELAELTGTGINVVQNLQNFRCGEYPGKYPSYGSV